jgi:hypothetical protein
MSKLKKAISNPNGELKPPSKNDAIVWEEYLDMKSNQMAPASNQVVEQFGLKFYLWSKENKSALRMHEFCAMQGISRNTLMRWRDKNEKFRQYYEEGLLNLADRREIGAINRAYDSNIIAKSMAFYDPEWLEAEERRAKQADGIAGKGNVTVVMQSFDEEKK